MKKLFALLLALCMMLCTAAMAETAELADLDAAYVPLEKIGMQMLVFNGMVEDPDAQAEDGADLLYAWKDAEGGDDYLRIEGQNLGIADPETLLGVLQGSGYEDAEIVELPNGLKPVVFNNAADNQICAALAREDGVVYGFSMGPVAGQEEQAALVLGLLLGSLAPIE